MRLHENFQDHSNAYNQQQLKAHHSAVHSDFLAGKMVGGYESI